MSLIKKLFSHGVSFTAGVFAGRASKETSDATYHGTSIWKGDTNQMEVSYEDSQQKLEKIAGWLDYDWDDYQHDSGSYGVQRDGMPPFWESDLKDLGLKISQAQAEAEEGETVTFEVTDRERLLIFDLTFGGPPAKDIRNIGKEQLGWETSDS